MGIVAIKFAVDELKGGLRFLVSMLLGFGLHDTSPITIRISITTISWQHWQVKRRIAMIHVYRSWTMGKETILRSSKESEARQKVRYAEDTSCTVFQGGVG